MAAKTKQPLLTGPLKLFMATMILANIASGLYAPYLSIYLYKLGASIEQVGLFFTLSQVAPLAFQILGGWLSDVMGRLQAIAIGSLVGLLSFAIYLVAPTWEWLLLATTASAMTRSLVGPSWQAFIAEQSTEETRGRVYGMTEALFQIVGMVGPLAGGLLSEHYGFKALFFVGAILYGVAAVMRVAMARHAHRQETAPRERPSFAGLKTSLAQMTALVLAGGVISWLFITDGVRDIAFNMENQLRPLYMQNLMGISNTQIGILASASSTITFVLMTGGGWLSDKKGERVGICAGYVLWMVGQVVFLTSHGFYGFLISWSLFGAAWAIMGPAYSSLISKAVPDRLRGTAFGLLSTSIGLIALPAPYLGGLLWEKVDPRAPFIALPIAIVALLPIMWIKFRLPKGEGKDQLGGDAAADGVAAAP